MKVWSISLAVVMACVMTSCAGIGIFNGAQAEFDRGLALFNQGKYEEAIPHFSRASELESEFTKAYIYLGRSHLNLGNWSLAIPPLRTAFRLSPSETSREVLNLLLDALLGAAAADFQKGRLDESVHRLREALQLDPESQKARRELAATLIGKGQAFLSEGRTSEAISVFSEAARIAPDNVQAYLGLARSFLKNGDVGRALSNLGRALSAEPASQETLDLLKQLIE